jgi:hypothetical protein
MMSPGGVAREEDVADKSAVAGTAILAARAADDLMKDLLLMIMIFTFLIICFICTVCPVIQVCYFCRFHNK